MLCSALTQVAGADHHLFRIKARHALWSVPDSNGTEHDFYRNLRFSSRHRRCQQDSNLHLLLFRGRMRFFHQRRHPKWLALDSNQPSRVYETRCTQCCAPTTSGETKAIVVEPTKNPAETRQGILLHIRIALGVLYLNDVFLWKARQAVLQTLTFFSDLPIFSMRNDQSLYSSFFLN